jgi:hypothetical protein
VSQNQDLLSHKINQGVEAAIAQAIERHRKLGESIAVWRDGQVVVLTADQIPPMQPSAPVAPNPLEADANPPKPKNAEP